MRRTSRDRACNRHAVGATPDPKPAAEAEPLYDDYLIKPVDLRQLLEKHPCAAEYRMDLRAEERASVRDRDAAVLDSALLPRDDIDELINLGQIGYVRGIHEKLTRDREQLAELHATSSRRCAAS